MLHFQQLSSGIKSQLSEMIEEKEKLKRSAKDDQDSVEYVLWYFIFVLKLAFFAGNFSSGIANR